MKDNIVHLEVQMTGNRQEDTRRRAQALEIGLKAAAADPLVALTMALGRAYSALHGGGEPRHLIIQELRDLISDSKIRAAAIGFQTRLRARVAARTAGNKCGDYIGQFQLELLDEVLIPTEEPPYAA